MRLTLLLLVLLAPGTAQAQGLPACGPAREGQVACQANRLCACRFERGGSLAGRPDRWAWDCGALRPDCQPPPADLPRTPGPDITIQPLVIPKPPLR